MDENEPPQQRLLTRAPLKSVLRSLARPVQPPRLDSMMGLSRASSMSESDADAESMISDTFDAQSVDSLLDTSDLQGPVPVGGGLRVNLTSWRDALGYTEYCMAVEHWELDSESASSKMQVVSTVWRRYSEFRAVHRHVGKRLGVAFRSPRMTSTLSGMTLVKDKRASRLGSYVNSVLHALREQGDAPPATLLTFLGMGDLVGKIFEDSDVRAAVMFRVRTAARAVSATGSLIAASRSSDPTIDEDDEFDSAEFKERALQVETTVASAQQAISTWAGRLAAEAIVGATEAPQMPPPWLACFQLAWAWPMQALGCSPS